MRDQYGMYPEQHEGGMDQHSDHFMRHQRILRTLEECEIFLSCNIILLWYNK